MIESTAAKSEVQRIKAIREALRAKYGAGKHRITGCASYWTVEVYSQKPNSSETGWWVMGDLVDAENWLGL